MIVKLYNISRQAMVYYLLFWKLYFCIGTWLTREWWWLFFSDSDIFIFYSSTFICLDSSVVIYAWFVSDCLLPDHDGNLFMDELILELTMGGGGGGGCNLFLFVCFALSIFDKGEGQQ